MHYFFPFNSGSFKRNGRLLHSHGYLSHTCITIHHVDTTIRNLDERAYRTLKARAALSGQTIGELLNEAIISYLSRPSPHEKKGSLRDLVPEPYPEGCEDLSESTDRVLYGAEE